MLLGGGCSYIQNKALQTPSISKKEGAWEYEQKCPQGIKTFLYHLNLLSFLYSRLELYTLTVLLYNKRHHFWWSNHKGTARQFRPAIQRLDMHLKWPLVMQNLQERPNSLQFLHRQCFTKLKALLPTQQLKKLSDFIKREFLSLFMKLSARNITAFPNTLKYSLNVALTHHLCRLSTSDTNDASTEMGHSLL